MLISEEYSGFYVAEQVFNLHFLEEICNALEDVTVNPKTCHGAYLASFFHEDIIFSEAFGKI